MGDNPGDESGSSVAGAGDYDGDGLDDFLIGSPVNGEAAVHAGKSYLILGSTQFQSGLGTVSAAELSVVGEGTNSELGGSLASAGDVDNDGRSDLLLGAPGLGIAFQTQGRAYLVLSPY